MINQIGQYILVRRGSSFLSNGEEVRRPNEGWIFWGKSVHVFLFTLWICFNKQSSQIYNLHKCFVLISALFHNIDLLSLFQTSRKGNEDCSTPTTPCGIVNAYKTRYDLWFTISLLSLSSAVKSDAGKMTALVNED